MCGPESWRAIRHGRFRDSDILRKLFETAVRGCMKADLVGGEGFAVDASVIEANVSGFLAAYAEGWTAAEIDKFLAAMANTCVFDDLNHGRVAKSEMATYLEGIKEMSMALRRHRSSKTTRQSRDKGGTDHD